MRYCTVPVLTVPYQKWAKTQIEWCGHLIFSPRLDVDIEYLLISSYYMYVDAQSYIHTFMMSDDNKSVELSKFHSSAHTAIYEISNGVQTVKL